MVLLVLGIVALAGAGLVLLPTVARKVVVSLLILLHFSSIMVSITSVPPPNGGLPWLPVQAWAHIYRPYGSFMYLNNAYHFYSPEPGPPTLAWFYVCALQRRQRPLDQAAQPERQPTSPMHYQRLHCSLDGKYQRHQPQHAAELQRSSWPAARRLAGKLDLFDPEIPLPFEAAPRRRHTNRPRSTSRDDGRRLCPLRRPALAPPRR